MQRSPATRTRVRFDDLVGLQALAQRIRRDARRTKPRAGEGVSPVTARRGRGMDYEESRPYQPGDDARRMDWRVTARRGEPHFKVYRAEREQPVLFVVDVGSSMAFATQGVFKSVLAARAAALLAWLSVLDGDRVGGVVFADAGTQRALPPRARDAGALALFRALEVLQVHHASHQQPAPAALETALLRTARTARPGSRVVVLSDFRDLADTGARLLARLALRHDVLVGQVFDPSEFELPAAPQLTFSDGTALRSLRADTAAVRAAFAARVRAHREQLAHASRAATRFTLNTALAVEENLHGGGRTASGPGRTAGLREESQTQGHAGPAAAWTRLLHAFRRPPR